MASGQLKCDFCDQNSHTIIIRVVYNVVMSRNKEGSLKGSKLQPTQPSGILKIAGKKVSIRGDAVSSKKGSSSKILLKRLKEAAKKSLFPSPISFMNG